MRRSRAGRGVGWLLDGGESRDEPRDPAQRCCCPLFVSHARPPARGRKATINLFEIDTRLRLALAGMGPAPGENNININTSKVLDWRGRILPVMLQPDEMKLNRYSARGASSNRGQRKRKRGRE